MNNSDPTIWELFDLSGKTALVTGGTGYLGSAMCHALAEAGASVVVASTNLKSSEAAANKLSSKNKALNKGVVIDYFDHNSIQYGFEQAIEFTGNINILVNNGHGSMGGNWSNINPEQFNKELGNATGCFMLARLVYEHAVKKKNAASIIMLGSMYGQVASYPETYMDMSPPSVAYQTIKAGIIQMTRHLAVYWAKDGVRVNCISPGPLCRPKGDPILKSRLPEKVPMQRIGLAYEMKGAVVYLASDASSYVTGHNLNVNGGWTAW